MAPGKPEFGGRLSMLLPCIILTCIDVGSYMSGDETFISGANLAISVVTLLLLPIFASDPEPRRSCASGKAR